MLQFSNNFDRLMNSELSQFQPTAPVRSISSVEEKTNPVLLGSLLSNDVGLLGLPDSNHYVNVSLVDNSHLPGDDFTLEMWVPPIDLVDD